MREQDYADEFDRRIRMYHPRSSMYQRVLDQEWSPPRAEDQPDPTRRKWVWDETLGTHIYLSEPANPYKADRGEG